MYSCFKNAYELLNIRALKILMLYKINIFQSMGRNVFAAAFKILERLDLRARKCFWNAPQALDLNSIPISIRTYSSYIRAYS